MKRKINTKTKENSKLTKDEWREYTKTVWVIPNTSHPIHPAVFPFEIPKRLIKLFSFQGETVLDPFAGIGTTAKAALEHKRKAICVEQSKKYCNLIKEELKAPEAKHSLENGLQIVHGDSRKLDFLKDESVQLIITSPPYWDKANYGRSSKNLGNTRGYMHFFAKIHPVFSECFRVLESGRKLCIVIANVNQYTDCGLLTFPLSSDFSILLREIGFVMVSELIWSKDGTGGRWGSWGKQRPIFGSYPYPPNFLFKNVHEYILIFAKPPKVKRKGPKAKTLSSLMALPKKITGKSE